ncbi:MAG: FecR domain-containing protein [Campylobacterales bacterium]|nr:FecR domain-containing protein [Campylobacterales bacterium]
MKLFLILILFSSVVFSASVAKVLSESGNPIVVRNGNKFPVKKGSLLYEKDTVLTDRFSKLRVVFIDKTVISIGKNSKFIISKYAFNKTNQEAFFSFHGAMKTVTGKIGKIKPDKFKVKLRTNTIGIRGTKFYIDTSRNTTAACIDGAITITKPKTWQQKLKSKVGRKIYSEANETIREELLKQRGSQTVVKAGQISKIGPSGIPSIPRVYSMAEIKLLAGAIGLSAAEILFDLGFKATGGSSKKKKETLKEQVHKKPKREKIEDRFKIHEL